MVEAAVFLEVGVLFTDLSPTVECMRHLASQLSCTDALIWCARANLIVSNSFNTDEIAQAYLLRTFFPELPELASVSGWLRENAQKGARVFFRAQFLELAYWVARFSQNQGDDGRSFESAKARRLFGQAALVAAGLWSARVNNVMATIPSTHVVERRREIMLGVRASLDENARGPLPFIAVGRGALLWSKYLPEQWPGSDEAFSDAVGVSREEYFRSFAALIAQHVDIRPSRLNASPSSAGVFNADIWDQSDQIRRPFRRLLEDLSTPIEGIVQLALNGDRERFLSQLRKRPIIRTLDGRLVVLDPTFLTALAVVGPLFAIRGKRPDDYQRFVHFGNAFEAYVAELVATRYPNGTGLVARSFVRGKLWRGKKVITDIDAGILTGHRRVCLVEAKAVFMPENALRDLEAYHAAITQKYGTGPERPKGVAQLARTVRELATGTLTEVPDLLRDAQTIFPVLLVYDRLLDAPGHGAFLLEQFVDELQPDERLADGMFRKGGLVVAAPIVLPVDDFEWIEASLASIALGDLLSEYSAADPVRSSDVRTFAFHSRFWPSMKHPEAAASAALKVLADLGLTAFGEEWKRASTATNA